jgi:hypothetical protein
MPASDSLSSETVLYWRLLCEHLKVPPPLPLLPSLLPLLTPSYFTDRLHLIGSLYLPPLTPADRSDEQDDSGLDRVLPEVSRLCAILQCYIEREVVIV